MYTKRHTAKKVFIKQLLGKKVVTENNATSIEVDEKLVYRVNIIGTIVQKYVAKNFIFLTIDDSTESIRIKAFNEEKALFENLEVGDDILLVGRLREYNDELYISPEIASKITSPNLWMLRKLEIIKENEKPKEKEDENEIEDEVIETPRTIILKKITEHSDEGVTVEQLTTLTPFNEETVTNYVNDLLRDGEIFEPRPGKLKLI